MKNRNKAIAAVIVVCSSLVLSFSTLLADEYKDAKKAYEVGQNDEALRLLVIKLRKDNDHKDAIALFRIVLPLAIDKHQKTAQDNEVRKDWDNAFAEYEALLRISEMISSITPLEETKVDGKKSKSPSTCLKLMYASRVKMSLTMPPRRTIKKVCLSCRRSAVRVGR